MIVVMQAGATEPQVQAVIDRMVELGFDVHRSTGVLHTVLGGVGGKEIPDLALFEVLEGVKEESVFSPRMYSEKVMAAATKAEPYDHPATSRRDLMAAEYQSGRCRMQTVGSHVRLPDSEGGSSGTSLLQDLHRDIPVRPSRCLLCR